MSRVRNAEKELNHSLRLLYALLKIIGAWPRFVSTPVFSKIFKWCSIFVCYFLQIMLLIPSFIYIFGKETNNRRKLKLITPHVNGVIQLTKYTLLLYRLHDFEELMEVVKNDWLNATEENLNIFWKNVGFVRKSLLSLAIVLYSGGFCNRTIIPLSKGTLVLPNNVTIRLLSSQGHFVFFDEQRSPNYEIIFTLQVLGGFIIYTILCSTLGLISLLCVHASSLLRILTNMMIEFSNQPDTSDDAVQEKIKDIVEYRATVKKFSNKVEHIMSYICCLEIFNGTCIACMVGYCIIMEWENSDIIAIITNLMLQTCCMFIIFIVCYSGQLLINESEYVKQTSVTLNWHRFSSKKARCLILVMIISNYRIKITAANMLEISLITFTDILKASMGYLNVLQSSIK